MKDFVERLVEGNEAVKGSVQMMYFIFEFRKEKLAVLGVFEVEGPSKKSEEKSE